MRIRALVQQDFGELLSNLPIWIKDHPAYIDYHVDTAHTRTVLESMKEMLHGQVLIDSNGEIRGAIIFLLAPTFYSPCLEASELVYFIEPEFRSYRNAVHLIKKASEDVFSKGAVRVTMGNSGGHRTATIEKLYTRLGFHPASGTYYKEE